MSAVLQYLERPHAARYMRGTLYPTWMRSGLREAAAPSAVWRGYQVPERDLQDFARLCGLAVNPHRLPPLLVHATAFRLQMALLAHRSAPVPIWRVLQVRNQLLDLRPVAADAALDVECRVHAYRALAKGLEIDLHTRILAAGALIAESMNTFYVRGLVGKVVDDFVQPTPPEATDSIASWRMTSGGSWRFGALTGDYNPVHMWSPYARMMGFRGAFFHPLRVVGHCLARAALHDAGGARRLDVWMKGPVYHDAPVELRQSHSAQGTTLALLVDGDPRPAVITCIRACSHSASVVPERSSP